MPFFNGFPYSDYDQINLDWVIRTCQEALDKALEAMGFSEDTKEYVDNYFANLDVQDEINNKIDQMADDGDLLALMTDTITNVVSSWLTDHITNPTNPPIDTTLSVAGAAADSKTVGDTIYDGRDKSTNVPAVTTRFTGLASLTDMRDMPNNSWGLLTGSEIEAIAGPNLPSGFLAAGQSYVVEKRQYIAISSLRSYFIYTSTKATMLGGWATTGNISWMVINAPLDTALTSTTAAAQGKAAGDAIAQVRSDVFDAIYRTRNQSINTARVMVQYTGDGSALTDLRDLPPDSYWIATGTTIASKMNGVFPWTLGSGSMRVEKISNAATDTSFTYKILSFAGATQYIGWVAGSGNISWYHPVYPAKVNDDSDLFRYTYTTFDWSTGEWQSDGTLSGTGRHSQMLQIKNSDTIYLGHRDANSTHTIYGAFFDAGGRFISNLTRSMMSTASYDSPNGISGTLSNYVTIYKFTSPSGAVYLSINEQTDPDYSYRTFISNVLCFPYTGSGNVVLHKGDPRYTGQKLCIIGASNIMIDRWYRSALSQYVCGFQEYLTPYFSEIKSLGYSERSWCDYIKQGNNYRGFYNYIVTDAVDLSGYDVFILWASSNGVGIVTPSTYDSTDPTTYFGALNGVIDYILTANPYAKIILPTFGTNNPLYDPFLTEYDKLSKDGGFELLDMRNVGISLDRKPDFTYDGTHQNQIGNLTTGLYLRRQIVG